ncbi:MAG: prepilin-type N-terminal cleavage/methylation domain-containing protein [Clostridiales bacterium]|nr:prepilin-type N-terminal cleavage/methylation domain-containing protein [Clostridiales bacterium]
MKERKMNNKGFSLVELIIVIAIMAILIVVLAPQYLRYVERSRNSTDMQNATEIVTAIQIYAADPEASDPITTADDGAVIKIGSSGGSVSGGTSAITTALTDAGLTVGDIKCSSRTNWIEYTITVNVAGTGNVSFDYGSSDSTGTNSAFEDSMKGN